MASKHRIGRWILWGFIGVLVLGAVWFGLIKYSYRREMKKLRENVTRAQHGGSAPEINIIALIIDGGGRRDVWAMSGAENIFDLTKYGAYTWSAETVFPSWTTTALISLATGLRPAKHGILSNQVDIKDVSNWPAVSRYLSGKMKTVSDYTKAAGLKVIVVTEENRETKSRVNRFLTRNVDEVLAVEGTGQEVLGQAAKFLHDPANIILGIHVPDVDLAGHRFGWGSPEQLRASALTDEALGKFWRALRKSPKRHNTYFIITADHGGHNRTHGTNAPEDMAIPWIIIGPNIKRDHEISGPVKIYDTAATVLFLLGIDVPPDWDGQPVHDAFHDDFIRDFLMRIRTPR